MAQPPNNPPPYNEPGYDAGVQDEKLSTGAPVISAAPARIFFILGGVALFFGIVLFSLLGGDDAPDKPVPPPTVIAQDSGPEVSPPLPELPEPPPAPPLQEDVTPPPMPDIPIVNNGGPDDKERLQRIRSNMLAVNNTSGLKGILDQDEEEDKNARDTFASGDPNLVFANRAYGASEAEKSYAKRMGNMNSMIAQGKIIHAVLETAINTQLPGTLRAIVSRDIYAEQGRNVLIPKGSRLIGSYNTNIFRGQDRVYIVWTRVIRPDGIDLYINSPGVDQLGRAGMEGFLDQKYKEIFTGAIMTTVLGIGSAFAADAVGGGDITTTANTDGSSSSTGDPKSFAVLNTVGELNRIGRNVVDGLLDLRPTITVDQGTRVNVFVNRDLIFPGNLADKTMFIE